ncbi:SCO1/SenC-domain-containing protein [Lyophyllum atratum]|nr:SCO1/SenC-domain-containing protein [Lyophyllum atratum]
MSALLMPTLRKAAFGLVIFFSIIVLALSAHALNTTTTLFGLYFNFTALGVAAAALSLVSLPAMLVVDNMRKGAFTSMILVEIAWLGLLWVLWLATAASASSLGSLGRCNSRNSTINTLCHEIGAIQAFAHLAWLALFAYLAALLTFSVMTANRGYNRVWYQSVKETDFNAPPVAQAQQPMQTQYMPAQDTGVAYPPQGSPAPGWAALFIIAGIGLFYYFRYEKVRLLEQREQERASKQYGRPQIGGPFNLTTPEGQPFTEQDLQGKWPLVYFGFTNCPDICPEELDKMTAVLNVIEEEHGKIFQPVFISVDPARDTPSRVGTYLKDFHPSFVGLVGTYDATKAVCKAYRVYFSTPPNADPAGDYLVDHSIFVYLLDPHGKFVEAFGQAVPKEDIIAKVGEVVEEWKKETGKKV